MEEIKCAERHWIKETVTDAFDEETSKITTGHDFEKNIKDARRSSIHRWKGIIRIKMLHQNMDASDDTKHPEFLPSDAHVTRLLIEDSHRRVLHGGVFEILTELRER